MRFQKKCANFTFWQVGAILKTMLRKTPISFLWLGMLILCVSLSAHVWAGDVKGKVQSLKGSVEFAEPGSSKFQPLKEGMEILPGSTVVTKKASEAVIVTVPGAAIQVAENTEVVLQMMYFEPGAAKGIKDRKTLVDLKKGTISALIDPKKSPQTDFRIKTPQGVAAARGTFYGVTVKNGQTFVAVKHGKVGVEDSSLHKE
jgi:hypothetical protein